MDGHEIIMQYVIPVIVTILGGIAAFLGSQIKNIYEKHVNDKTKEAVVRTCVKAAEQLYHDLDGAEKLKKAQEGIVAMLNEKGIPISKLEMNAIIESVVSEFNYGFGVKELVEIGEIDPTEIGEIDHAEIVADPNANEEEGASL